MKEILSYFNHKLKVNINNITTGVKCLNQQVATSKPSNIITEPEDPIPRKQQRVETSEPHELTDKEIQKQLCENTPVDQNVAPENLIVALPDGQEIQSENNQIDPQYKISDQDILTAFTECEQNEQMMQTQHVSTAIGTSTKQVVSSKKSSPRVPMFTNCHVSGNITIHTNKN